MDQLSMASTDYCNMRISLWLFVTELSPGSDRCPTTSAGMADANSTTRLQSDKTVFRTSAMSLLVKWQGTLAYRQGIGRASRETWGA